MEQLFLDRIIREIEDKAELEPQKLTFRNYEELEQPYLALASERTQWEYYKKLNSTRNYHLINMTKHRVIRLMMAGVFDEYWTNELNITKTDVNFEYSKIYHIKHYILGLEPEWKEQVILRGSQEKLAEEKASREYMSSYNKKVDGSLLRTLQHQNTFYRNNPAPRFVVEGWLTKYTDEIQEQHYNLKQLINSHDNGDLAENKFKKQRNKLHLDIKVSLRKKRQAYQDIFKNSASNKRMIYVRAVPPENQQHIIPPIIVVTSWRHGKDLIGDYRDWYNTKYANEIAQEKARRKKERDGGYYQNRDGVAERKAAKNNKKRYFADLIEEGCSQSEAARMVGISKSTGNRWANDPKICNPHSKHYK